MTEEEKSVINKLESIRVNVEGKLYNFEAARILYLINKLKKENEEKDKQIDLMAEHIVSSSIVDDTVCAIKCDCESDILEDCSKEKMLNCTKEYFERKATNIG